ncbi:hypothetical membrane protein [Renibacterium salmoninarum ATCC 33209]|uniref:Hypothetical membrane protein n=2 Tax=Renibacterium salmoninarum TaxID=1646 RepID=A9WNH5_RENSM|nr:hypothetical membrane protein [Renibacterium salmoninarum ATCC 33209]
MSICVGGAAGCRLSSAIGSLFLGGFCWRSLSRSASLVSCGIFAKNNMEYFNGKELPWLAAALGAFDAFAYVRDSHHGGEIAANDKEYLSFAGRYMA